MLVKTCIVFVITLLCWLDTGHSQTGKANPGSQEVRILVHAGKHDRVNVPVSVLLDAPSARSAYVQYEDGSYGRAGVVQPGIHYEAAQAHDKVEVFFGISDLKKGQMQEVIVKLSEDQVDHRHYVWSGEPLRSRRLSCTQCHQGLSLPNGAYLEHEREAMKKTGKPTPFPKFEPLPTSKGRDFRWHAILNRYVHSACYECHGRHIIEYHFGQSIDQGTPYASEPDTGLNVKPYNVYYGVFRVKGDQLLTHGSVDPGTTRLLPAGIHFGTGSDLQQQHARILKEEANKFIGRHTVMVNWLDPNGRILVEEDRQVTVKNMRATNEELALWIDCASLLRPTAGTEEKERIAGWHFVFPTDAATSATYRRGDYWCAATFVADGYQHTAVYVDYPDNPRSIRIKSDQSCTIGFDYNLMLRNSEHRIVQCLLWLQGGKMADSEIMDLVTQVHEPVYIEVK